jgi:TPR repeat protein
MPRLATLIAITAGLTLGAVQSAHAQASSVAGIMEGAAQGDAVAQDDLATLYEWGAGVPLDHAEAARLYRLAAEQGYPAGQYNLGNVYAHGIGVVQDNVRAYMWYSIAADEGDEDGPYDRDRTASLLTADQIAQAQEMARRCMESDYSLCD